MSNSVSLDIVAAGTTQATATPLPAYTSFIEVSTCTSVASGVCLPGAVTGNTGNSLYIEVGRQITIRNDGVATLMIYPPTGVSINLLAVNLPIGCAPGTSVIVEAVSLTQYMSSSISSTAKALSVAAATTLLPSQSGAVISFTKTATVNYTITLPAPTTAGLEFTIVQGGPLAATSTVNITGGAGVLLGNWIETIDPAIGGSTDGTAITSLNFLPASVLGDGARFVSNGANWFAQAMTGVATGLSFN